MAQGTMGPTLNPLTLTLTLKLALVTPKAHVFWVLGREGRTGRGTGESGSRALGPVGHLNTTRFYCFARFWGFTMSDGDLRFQTFEK